MAKDSTDSLPMHDGSTTSSGIMTPMNSANIQQKGSAKEHTYEDMPSGKGGESIDGPGVKGAWKK
jgi:hypothetical protein